MSSDALPSAALLAFQLGDWLDALGGDDHGTFLAMLEMAHKLAADEFMPHYRQADLQEPTLDTDGVHILPAIKQALAGLEAGDGKRSGHGLPMHGGVSG